MRTQPISLPVSRPELSIRSIMSTETTTQPLPLSPDTDLVSRLAGLSPGGNVAALRAARADATRYTQGSHDALFSADIVDLSLNERLYAAWYAASLTQSVAAANAYRERLLATDADSAENITERLSAITLHGPAGIASLASSSSAAGSARLAAILHHTRALITQPAATGKSELAALLSAGLTTRAIVALAQLVAFVSYQVRVVVALKALDNLEHTA
ncbi:CMD domain protein [Paraburkholderia sp. D15]|uniref:CMD domain protein n=1 Tax=Paraburkholderia sp. D15 TaxID=2880218 RepID=UPI0024798472|nr:CMD domain protein [Paraburkholderia sp. D15]WGS52709.1 CMD domain protein [Paraburkholderia sp. D15]